MSISINSVSRTSPVTTTLSPVSTVPTASTDSSKKGVTDESDGNAETTTPVRFPWLSRLTSELEPVAKKKPAFPSTPSLGENLDQAA